MSDQEGDWDFYLRILSNSARDSTDPASDPSILQSVKKLHGFCKMEKSDDLVARIYPQFNKVFHRSVASLSQSESGASKGLLLLAILQFFLDFGDMVLHDSDPSLRTFFRSCLSREFSDAAVAEATCEFLVVNQRKLLASFPNLLPQFFPLLLKLIAWNWEKLEKSFLKIFPGLISPGSFLPLFPSIVDLPILVVALEKVERSSGSGSRVGGSIASIQKSAAPEMLLALMDEAYTGSTIGDGGDDSESEDNNTIDVADPLFLELLKDENDGLAERHRASPTLNAALQAAASGPRSERMKQTLKIAPRLLDVYFSVTLRDANDSLICALIPLLMTRNSTMFPDKIFSHEIRRRLLEFVLAAFQRSPNFIALLKKPIIDRLGEAYDDVAKRELALQLCWAIGEYGGGGESHKEAARELFESLELLVYENLSSSRLGLRQESGNGSRRTTQSRLLCFVVTAIAKLATYHRELLPRARVALGKVVKSRISDARVWRRAHDYLGLMNEPGICWSVLGPSRVSEKRFPGTVNWSEGGQKMVAHIPFHILSEQGGPPFHDFAFSDIIPKN
ncbi:putative AP-5 complex subunit zeta-1 protein [Arabidopsis thaliana]|uniref:AP-5 complex subunit zeta-1 n=4 Tax=Arabidopsis TaxID=3701 RepID=Q8H1F1_ARATH|nr:AP-5 complex subunit zeta-1 [Arabidopsis thaliana]KAG7625305.1 AP-5 complex subunit zeta-1 [Arabidopsis thaliana x Arabidopsis arenosa]AAN12973.1 unknown protein [Arabidopsis thaliana]AEE75626.1 AP-5 complex subunit zeta-1 [Arabidopsis thaliana]OAP05160.1 hypothetical protein AXX17_AT3G15820 [Arabidopsis thaliana]VYS57438.1 unnamed protein product [Arabidopsis thaliana]|eukprot:NP_188134.2 AP-5 complex subunit zeta-1 [Arabidopsis thaliana]